MTSGIKSKGLLVRKPLPIKGIYSISIRLSLTRLLASSAWFRL